MKWEEIEKQYKDKWVFVELIVDIGSTYTMISRSINGSNPVSVSSEQLVSVAYSFCRLRASTP